jgi:hypothetical protein
MTCADFKSTKTMVPSWHIAKRIERGDVVLPLDVVAVVLIVSVAADVAVVVVAVGDVDGMEQIAVIPQTETNFGFVATAGEKGVDSTIRLGLWLLR